MGVNKIQYYGRILLDLSGDTVAPDKLLKGHTAHDCTGAKIEGEMTQTVIAGYVSSENILSLSGVTQEIDGTTLRLSGVPISVVNSTILIGG